MDSSWLQRHMMQPMLAGKWKQAGHGFVKAFRRSGITATRSIKAASASPDEVAEYTATMKKVLALERGTGWTNTLRSDKDIHATFSDVLAALLVNLESIAPRHMQQEVAAVREATLAYSSSDTESRQMMTQRVEALLNKATARGISQTRRAVQPPIQPPPGWPAPTQGATSHATPQLFDQPQSAAASQDASTAGSVSWGGPHPQQMAPWPTSRSNGPVNKHPPGSSAQASTLREKKNQQWALHKSKIRLQRGPGIGSTLNRPIPTWIQQEQAPPNQQPTPSEEKSIQEFARRPVQRRQQSPQTPTDKHHEKSQYVEASSISQAEVLEDRRQSEKWTSTSESVTSDIATGRGAGPVLTGRTDYQLYSRDNTGPVSGYDKLEMNLGSRCTSSKYKLIVFDTETNGIQDPGFSEQKLVEIAAYDLESGRGMQSLVNPEGPISDQVVGVHHINNAAVELPGVPTTREACLAFLDFVTSQLKDSPGAIPVLCAHNLVQFDWKVLHYNFGFHGLHWPDEWMFFDSLLAAKEWKRRNSANKLGDLLGQYNIAPRGVLHHAMTDVRGLAELVPRMMEAYGVQDLEALLSRNWKNKKVAGTMRTLNEEAAYGNAQRRRNAAKKESLKVRKAEEQRKAAAMLPTHSDPIQNIERQMLSKPSTPGPAEQQLRRDAWRGTGLEDGLTSNWAEILTNAVLIRELLDDKISTSKHFTPIQAKNLEKVTADPVETIQDVLEHYPRDYQYCFPRMQDSEYASVVGTVTKYKSYANHKFQTTEIEILVDPAICAELDPETADFPPGMGPQTVTYFKMITAFLRGKNLTNIKPKAAEGSQMIMQGKLQRAGPDRWSIDQYANLIFDWNSGDEIPPLILPVYAKRAPMEHRDWKSVINKVLKQMDKSSKQFWEPLPQDVLRQFQLKPWLEAVKEMHNPTNDADLEEARRRFAFEDLYLLQMSMLLKRQIIRQSQVPSGTARPLISKCELVETAKKSLTYKLTGAQETVLAEILEDMNTPAPMLRLLQGDVGCGKTIVAFLAVLAAVNSGFQAAIMAPTEVLVEQHYSRLAEVIARLPEKQRPTLIKFGGAVTKAGKVRNELLKGLADGSSSLVVGTKALASDHTKFQKLGLVIIDEQHKFGVQQRAKLQAKGNPLPHVLYMTATPIPRTLALVNHGDMTFSAIDEMPPGRQRVETVVIEDTESSTAQMYEEIRQEIQAGGRIFIVLCFIEESKSKALEEVKAAESEFQHLQESQVLGPDSKIGLLHGSLKSEEKEAAMNAFISGDTQVLVSTTLVEVGLDVRQASMMIIHNAERFGLAQLHQLRGRVGRGGRKSKCFLVHSDRGDMSHRRLSLMATEHNGLKLAESDLIYRGQGDVAGLQQSGKDALANLKVAKLPEHRVIMDEAREAAARLIHETGLDPNDWPPQLLIALSKRRFPKLDHTNLPGA